MPLLSFIIRVGMREEITPLSKNEEKPMNAIIKKMQELQISETTTDLGDDTTYVVRVTETEFAVCDNGEQVNCVSVAEAARIVAENVAANTRKT
jgi:hypothetical protein